MPHPLSATLCCLLIVLSSSCVPGQLVRPPVEWSVEPGPVYDAFHHPERVTLRGYDGDAMEPFLARDERYLFFNNSNDPRANTNLHYAERVDDLTFDYRGEVGGVNTPALEGVPSVDRDGNFYFISTRSYKETLSTIYRGKWFNGRVVGVELVAGVSDKLPGSVNFDAEISANGLRLYFVDGIFTGGPLPTSGDIAVAVNDGTAFRRLARSEGIFARINTDKLEYAPATSADELEIFFTRLDPAQKHIGIYRAARTSVARPFDAPQRIGVITGFVEASTLSADGKALYYHRKEGARYHIYRVTR